MNWGTEYYSGEYFCLSYFYMILKHSKSLDGWKKISLLHLLTKHKNCMNGKWQYATLQNRGRNV